MSDRILYPNASNMLRINLKYATIGIVIGLVINAFMFIGNSELQLRYFFFNICFAFFITLSVTNIVAIFQCNYSAANTNFWKYIFLYYACNLIGMAIGTELSYFLVYLSFNLKMTGLLHLQDYKFNSLVVMIIGTVFLLLHMQKVNAQAALTARENDLAKAKQLHTEIELQALQSKINPHFLYNALNSIVSLIHEYPDKAEDMTIKLSKLFRYSINSMQENQHSLTQELEILGTYLDIEKVRFGDRMTFEIIVPDELKAVIVPRFLIQPLVENSIKHGLKNKSSGALIRVQIEELNERLIISIADNGIPFPDDMQMGHGLQSTFEKLKLLYGANQDFQFINEPKQIKISIPYKV
jgi:two-component system LytT family sensor kinase